MNVLKNMEAIFVIAAALATVTTYANAEIPEARAAHKAQVSVQGDAKIAVVKISAKRAA
jgi:hypothetical protein